MGLIEADEEVIGHWTSTPKMGQRGVLRRVYIHFRMDNRGIFIGDLTHVIRLPRELQAPLLLLLWSPLGRMQAAQNRQL